MTPTRRETARERDERIVAEAGPWEVDSAVSVWPKRCDVDGATDQTYQAALRAAARILNRLTRKRRKGKL